MIGFVVLIVVAILLTVLFVGAVGVFVAVTGVCVVFFVAAISLISAAALVAIPFLLFADNVLRIEFVRKYRLLLFLPI